MIRFALTCDKAHEFDSWFQSAAAFDRLATAGQLACVTCGSSRVSKSLMAPAVTLTAEGATHADLRAKTSPAEIALAELRRKIEENSEYVGLNFAAEARAIHDGDAPERSIYGEARGEDARKLLDDGIPVAPLPFLPTRRAN